MWYLLFFFKQKTAYDLRISDWSSDVCSSDLRSYEVRTFGCQMNVHDSERLSGLLEDAGYVKAATGETPDLMVFNTCAVRENADNKLYGTLGQLVPVKTDRKTVV